MSAPQVVSGFAPSGNAQIYYETAGEGQPLVMIHAGVADSRQWNNEFASLAARARVVRFDTRGFGKSRPAEGEYSFMGDLIAVLDHLGLHEPIVLMGCSMGGGLAMDFTLEHPSRVKALIMVGSAPNGLELDAEEPAKFAEVEQASKAGDLDRVAELETQIWFDGTGRSPDQVNQTMRALAYEMNRNALELENLGLGTRVPSAQEPAANRLNEINVPVLVVVGAQDLSYIVLAADYMAEHIKSARKVVIEDAAHLPNMDHPEEFERIVTAFLDEIAQV